MGNQELGGDTRRGMEDPPPYTNAELMLPHAKALRELSAHRRIRSQEDKTRTGPQLKSRSRPSTSELRAGEIPVLGPEMEPSGLSPATSIPAVSYTHLRAHET